MVLCCKAYYQNKEMQEMHSRYIQLSVIGKELEVTAAACIVVNIAH